MFAPTKPLTELGRRIAELELSRATCDDHVSAVCGKAAAKVSASAPPRPRLARGIKVADVGEKRGTSHLLSACATDEGRR